MEDSNRRQSGFRENWHIRIPLMLATAGVLLVVASPSVLANAYWGKVLVVCFCLGALAFINGFLPQPITHRRSLLRFFPLCVTSIYLAAIIAGIYEPPVSERLATMLKPYFLVTCLLFAGSFASGFAVGEVLFRRMYPGVEVQEEELERSSPAHRRVILKYTILVFASSLPAFVALAWFPKYWLTGMLVTMALFISLASFFVGTRWEQLVSAQRRLSLAFLVAGPVGGFIGFFGGSKAQDSIHFFRALGFAAMIALAMWLPARIARVLSRRA